MKKIIISLLLVISTVSICTGCGSSNSNSSSKPAKSKNKSTMLNVGDTIKLDFVEMTIDSINVETGKLVVETTRNNIVIPEISGSEYVTLRGKITNLYDKEINLSYNVCGSLVIADQYTYRIEVENGYNVAPLEQANYLIYVSVPEKAVSILKDKGGIITFGFDENFENKSDLYNACSTDYQYKVQFDIKE